MELNETQIMMYKSTIDYVLKKYPNEKVNRIFEMSIDMCDYVDWDNEEECREIFDNDPIPFNLKSKM